MGHCTTPAFSNFDKLNKIYSKKKSKLETENTETVKKNITFSKSFFFKERGG